MRSITSCSGFISPNLMDQITVVEELLDSLGCNQPIITVYNKMDLLDEKQQLILPVKKPVVYVSATNKVNLDKLVEAITENLPIKRRRVELLIPYTEGQALSQIHDQGQVIKEEYREDGIFIFAELDPITYGKFESYKIADQV